MLKPMDFIDGYLTASKELNSKFKDIYNRDALLEHGLRMENNKSKCLICHSTAFEKKSGTLEESINEYFKEFEEKALMHDTKILISGQLLNQSLIKKFNFIKQIYFPQIFIISTAGQYKYILEEMKLSFLNYRHKDKNLIVTTDRNNYSDAIFINEFLHVFYQDLCSIINFDVIYDLANINNGSASNLYLIEFDSKIGKYIYSVNEKLIDFLISLFRDQPGDEIKFFKRFNELQFKKLKIKNI
jgi:hypothetical protein